MQTRRLLAMGQVAAPRCVQRTAGAPCHCAGPTSPLCSIQAVGQNALQGLRLIPPLSLPVSAGPCDIPSGGLGCYQAICFLAGPDRGFPRRWASEAKLIGGDTIGDHILETCRQASAWAAFPIPFPIPFQKT